ncbi:Fe-S cluster assembly ATPase SufC [candidate division WWE3 bacterium RIFOXYB1_FULL_43_24]|uniref:FeS assembly ATPase SufC n=2 Tax=Katanobacteria TaxID=422282 RepID=A0A0G0YM05_UNCKA|nr:MAG: FeS assembly ATPase SufC [candidate division WWE3 bacterium GW2011_GWA1_42_12]KKS34720.1 MAG: FeS assembly ATPase SufC [candidate division WWE3 bacterium GW2011_GWD1_42_14]KKS37827.1 MAG: FeS assembly ATPase SufC [candidate division WWE3 bacterium GW2011_GWF1_42_14]KKS40193.1 MAG: FeS assembly ATPase SufC [candidate division WWE3 bacterium GW2011_GWE1_42_16]KKS66198.1 MAG: FeS assembly ATPase SufC [candidate division WWE3 bacterium GW2011_GWB1_42_6]OGC69041.1 MAG: Fe-S cluster assembly
MIYSLEVKNLRSGIEQKEILKGVDLALKSGEVHALMGRNGSGKSTLAQTLMGSPTYEVSGGTAKVFGKEILKLETTERAKTGLFLSFQYPSEIPGVKVYSYLRMLHNKSHEDKLSPKMFREYLAKKMELLEMDPTFSERFLNEGFSGGEKKRMEMLQMLMLEPKVIILDEVDSGLDIDAIKIVSRAVNYLIEEHNSSVLLITHYSRILNYIKPDFVHIMLDGKIVKTGGEEVASHLEEYGYSSSELQVPAVKHEE